MEPQIDATRHGAYICVRATPATRPALIEASVPSLAARLGFENEFDTAAGHPGDAIAFLRRVKATPADLEDDALLHAEAIVHVASASHQLRRMCGRRRRDLSRRLRRPAR